MVTRLRRWFDPLFNPLACVPATVEQEDLQNNHAILRQLARQLQRSPKTSHLLGQNKGIQQGQGLDFKDLRIYQPGDDLRRIDWNVLARTRTPYIRQYEIETQQTVWLFLDVSPSMTFGKHRTKQQVMLELVRYWTLLAGFANCKLGCVIVPSSHGTMQWLMPKHRAQPIKELTQRINQLQETEKKHRHTQAQEGNTKKPPAFLQVLSQKLPALQQLCKKQSTLVVISDFLNSESGAFSTLGKLGQHRKVLPIRLFDPVEIDLPSDIGLLSCMDSSTGNSVLVDTGNKGFHNQFYQASCRQMTYIETQLHQASQRKPLALSTDTSSNAILSGLLTLLKGCS